MQDQRVLLAAELAAKTSFQPLITALGFLGLLVGGVGILSIMLISVRERRGEIGLRLAVGARRRDLLVQFVAAALLLAGAGGMVGLLAGAGAARLVSSVTAWDARMTGGLSRSRLHPWPRSAPPVCSRRVGGPHRPDRRARERIVRCA